MPPRLSLPTPRARRVALVPEILPPESEESEPAVIPLALGAARHAGRDVATEYAAPASATVGVRLDVYG